MFKKGFVLSLYLIVFCLPAWPFAVTKEPLFPKELFLQIFPGSALELSRLRFIPAGLAPRSCAHGMQTFMKHRAMQQGQRAAYAHVEQQFKSTDDFFSRFFTTSDIQHINKIFLQNYNDDGIDPQQHGAFRSQPVFVPRKPLMLLQRVGHAVQAVIPEPPVSFENNDKQDTQQFLAYVEQNSTHAWTLLNGVAMPNWEYISTVDKAQLALDQKWTEEHIHIFPPHGVKDLINAELARQKVLGENNQAPKIIAFDQSQKTL